MKAPPQRDIMEVHRFIAHPSEHITRATAKATGITITGESRSCVECDQSKAHRHAVPRTTDYHASERAALLYVDLVAPTESESAGGSRCVMMIVDDFSRFKNNIAEDEVFGRNGGCARELYRDTYHPGTGQYPRRSQRPRRRV